MSRAAPRGRRPPPPRTALARLPGGGKGLLLQLLVVAGVVALGYAMAANAVANLARQNIASGFDFLDRTAGFEIAQTLIDYAPTDTYLRALWVGLLNTLLVAGLGIVLATILGFALGIARLSSNWLASRAALAYVELVRNMPPLLTLFIVYFAFLKALPPPRQSIELPLGALLNVRGLYLPALAPTPGSGWVLAAVACGAAAAAAWIWRAGSERIATGRRRPVALPVLALVLVPPLVAALAAGAMPALERPALKGFNVDGGIAVLPELLALLTGLTLYTAAFIAEIVRAGIAGVPKGQKEAAAALGLTAGQSMRLVVLPQALRIVVPPLVNQYLNLTKNSSLAVAIGYPDLVSVFAGTVLNNTNQAIETIAVTMTIYLALSLLTSVVMNRFNAQIALVER